LSPSLESLTIEHLLFVSELFHDRYGAPAAPWPTLDSLHLPHLKSLALDDTSYHIGEMIQNLPPPSRSLTIRTRTSHVYDIFTETSIIKRLFEYTQLFWSAASVMSQLPSTAVTFLDRGDSEVTSGLCMEADFDDCKGAELEIVIDVGPHDIVSFGSFLSSVVHCEIDVWSLNSIPWSSIDGFPELRSIEVRTGDVSAKLIDAVRVFQPWVDMRAKIGQHPLKIWIGHLRPYTGKGVRDHQLWLCTAWNTAEGPLAEAGWSNPSVWFLAGDDTDLGDNKGYNHTACLHAHSRGD
jgi:hypothetical protein